MKYIALDIGNVCIKVDHASAFARMGFRGAPGAEVLLAAQAFECGRLSADALFGVMQKQPETSGKSREELLDDFNSILVEPVAGMSELIKTLPARGIQPVFFSDISYIHLEGTRKLFPAAEVIPCGIYSFQVGALKPSEKLFRAFERRFGEPLLYVDDRKELIEAAQRHGWNAWQFESAAALADKLKLH